MTRREFIDKHKLTLEAFVTEAVLSRDKDATYITTWLRKALDRIEAQFGAMFDDLCPPQPVPVKPSANGTPAPLPRKV